MPGIFPDMGWVTQHAIAFFSALLAAFWAAVGIVVRQQVARDVPADKAMSATMATTLARKPLWWAGTLAAVAGYVFQALALANGSLLLVQPLLVSSLLFALPMSAKLAHRSVTGWQWLWAVVLASSVAVIVTVGNPQPGQSRASLETWTAVVAVTSAAYTTATRWLNWMGMK